jgi:hypothetical protein
MNLLRRAAELFISVAVIVVFAGLLAVPGADEGVEVAADTGAAE